jgi:hypothetical protein
MKPKMGIRAGQGLPKASAVANCNSNIRSGKAEKSLPIFTSVWFFWLQQSAVTSFSLLCILDAELFNSDPYETLWVIPKVLSNLLKDDFFLPVLHINFVVSYMPNG